MFPVRVDGPPRMLRSRPCPMFHTRLKYPMPAPAEDRKSVVQGERGERGDGGRDGHVTGVPTCALPISAVAVPYAHVLTVLGDLVGLGFQEDPLAQSGCDVPGEGRRATQDAAVQALPDVPHQAEVPDARPGGRSEERRAGREGGTRGRRTRWPRDWSSDVCSSDLRRGCTVRARAHRAG